MSNANRIEACWVTRSWDDGEPLGEVVEFSAAKTIDAEAPEIDSGDLSIKQSDVAEGYVRVYLCRESSTGYSRTPIGTYLLESTSEAEGKTTCELWSVLHPAVERKLEPGYYVPQGSPAAEIAQELLSECLEAPVTIEGPGERLADNIVASDGETYLSMAWAVLGEGWTLSTDGLGRVSVKQVPSSPVPLTEHDLTTKPSVSWDLANVPNAVTVSDGTRTFTAINDDPTSPTSTVARGRRIDSNDTSGERDDTETLEAYAYRLLAEQSKATQTAEYEKDITSAGAVVDLVTIPGLEGEWKVVSQSFEFDCGMKLSETSKREVSTYAEF